jgi:hypothetical protein
MKRIEHVTGCTAACDDRQSTVLAEFPGRAVEASGADWAVRFFPLSLKPLLSASSFGLLTLTLPRFCSSPLTHPPSALSNSSQRPILLPPYLRLPQTRQEAPFPTPAGERQHDALSGGRKDRNGRCDAGSGGSCGVVWEERCVVGTASPFSAGCLRNTSQKQTMVDLAHGYAQTPGPPPT